MGVEIGSPFDKERDGPGGWWILDEPELHLHDDAVVPDIAGWRRERMPKLPETAWFKFAPDWVCEVLSPGTARQDRVLRMPLYARCGVQYIWLVVEPVLLTLVVFENTGNGWLLLQAFENDNEVSVAPFAAISLNLAVLWADLRFAAWSVGFLAHPPKLNRCPPGCLPFNPGA
ncbi:Uma2 family endonuclease [Candidatus Methylospira mobilis]|uniref:Uma2 family endonuclease n=1 Tax=Candidatus Methylospira mobilis TaxID=1808979 RepID=UPI0028EFBF36|nr:Uma2 family endonuclease [Candidatus Methylospira mobilis]WNV06530.1 Uma2 family endonuclease [Candidatus Methylospira mobilis]